MLTPWGEAITPDNAWTEYPRPQLVRDAWSNLNGLWQYAIRSRAAPLPNTWDGQVLVPFCIESRLSGVGRHVSPQDRLWYRRTFPRPAADTRALLHFGAVDWQAAVWINGAYVGSHSGGFDPFSVDITGFLHDGDNELIVGVDDDSNAGEQPRGKQHLKPHGIWYTPVTGIWQTVWLECVPLAAHIAELRIDANLERAEIVVATLLARPTRDRTLAVTVDVSLRGRRIAHAIGRPERTLHIAIASPEHWSPETPTLYEVEVSLVRVPDPHPTSSAGSDVLLTPQRGRQEAEHWANAGPVEAVIDRVRSYFGMRSIAVGAHPQHGAPCLLLNGAPVFQLATLDQGWWPDGLHTAPADSAWVYEIEFLKAAGFNAVRKHIKVEPARYYYHCDRLGLLVWQDMPSGFLPAQFVAPNDETEGLRSSAAMEQHELELARMVRRLRAHPAIVVWVLHNEGWGQYDSTRLTQLIKSLDPTRPVNATSGWLDVGAGDFIDRHDYDPEPLAPALDEPRDGKRVRVIGEYGGIGWPIEGHLWNADMRNWGYQTLPDEERVRAAYARVTAAIVRAAREHGVCAAVYTQTSDVEGEVNGLLTYDRRVEKLPRAWLAEVHAPLHRPRDTHA